MGFLTDVTELRKVEWSKSYLWDIKFTVAPPPFNAWFPAADVELGLFSIESQQFEFYLDTFKVPKRRNSLGLRVSFYDDINHTLLDWFDEWAESMFTEGQRVKTIGNKDVSRQVQIVRLDNQHNTLGKTKTFFVYPEGDLSFTGNSQSESTIHAVTFVIVAKDKIEVSSKVPTNNSVGTVARTLRRGSSRDFKLIV